MSTENYPPMKIVNITIPENTIEIVSAKMIQSTFRGYIYRKNLKNRKGDEKESEKDREESEKASEKESEEGSEGSEGHEENKG